MTINIKANGKILLQKKRNICNPVSEPVEMSIGLRIAFSKLTPMQKNVLIMSAHSFMRLNNSNNVPT